MSISNNDALTSIEPGAFTNLKKLQQLDVTGNKVLARLESGTFDHAFDDEASSVVINLEGNGIRFMSPRAVNFDADGAPSQTIVVISSAADTSLDACCAFEWMKLDTHYVTNGLKCNNAKPHEVRADGTEYDLTAAETEFGCCLSKDAGPNWDKEVKSLHDTAINSEVVVGSYEKLNDDTKKYLEKFCRQSTWSAATKLDDSVPRQSCDTPAACPPDLMDFFKQKYVPSQETCGAEFDHDENSEGAEEHGPDGEALGKRACPDGSRVENIGKRYLLDCEPWVHEEREYVTRHAVAEQQCVDCVVQNCLTCDENYRHCDECDHQHSLYINPDTNVHSCVLTEECPGDMFSTNANEDKLHECKDWDICEKGQEETVAPTKLTDRTCEPIDITVAVAGSVAPILFLACCFIYYMRWKTKKKLAALKDMYGALHDQMSAVKTVCQIYDGGLQERLIAKANERAAETLAAKDGGGGGGGGGGSRLTVRDKPTQGKLIKAAQTEWYWEESAARVDSHKATEMLAGTGFVRFPKAVSSFLEVSFQTFTTKNGSPICGLPAHNSKWVPKEADGNRGTYFYHKDTQETTWTPPADYNVDLSAMTQVKNSTQFVRAIKRVETKEAVYASASPGSVRKKTKEEEKKDNYSPWKKKKKVVNVTSLPDQVLEQDGLVIEDGDLIQIKAETDDKVWSYGTILVRGSEGAADDDHGHNHSSPTRAKSHAVQRAHSTVLNSDETGVSNETGWFPTNCIRETEADEFKKVKHLLGNASADALAAPAMWDDVPQDKRFTAHRFELKDGAEKRKVVGAFQQSLKKAHIPITVVGVERIQNYAMWQSYAVKKIAVLNREKGYDENADTSKYVRGEANDNWLFHGTNLDVLPKIVQQGFNRSFCGKNATFYGKGVYFARDSAYSVKPHYAIPDRNGHQYMFVTRVVVGAFHEGRKDILTPDLRFPDLDVLYDSTVKGFRMGFSDTPWITKDDPADDPQIYVTYHDAQAYPEYLVKFKQGSDGGYPASSV